jgi:hypothetical protein
MGLDRREVDVGQRAIDLQLIEWRALFDGVGCNGKQ